MQTRTLVGALLLWAVAATAAHAQVRTDRPRIYLTPATLARLQTAGRVDDVAAVANYVDRRLAARAAADTDLRGLYPGRVCEPTFFVAATLRDATYVTAAHEMLALLTSLDPASGADTGQRNRLLCLAEGYDWLHDDLSASERSTIADAIIAHTTLLDAFITEADYVGGHSRWGNVTVLAGAIALAHDDARLDATLTTVLANWRDGYNPVLDDVGAGGGHHMGYLYGASYSNIEAALMWRSASIDGESWSDAFFRDRSDFYVYGTNGSAMLPLFGDCWDDAITEEGIDQVAYAASLGNGVAEQFFRDMPTLWEPFRVKRAMTADPTVAPVAIDTLPLARRFAGSGFVIARDGWDRATATLLVFKASPFYSFNHHHRDEGSFTLDYRGPLLLDAGYYDQVSGDPTSGYGGLHHSNFYTRSVAHDTLLVHWPEEPMRPGFVNDGGQRIPVSWADEPETVADLHGRNALSGIAGFDDAGACVWTRANLGDAYATEKVTTYVRDVLEVQRPGGATHPAIFVLDHATLPVARDAAVLWHFAQGVAIDGTRVTATSTSGDGHLRLEVLRPLGATLTPFTDADKWRVGAMTYPPAVEDGGTTPYWGRIEVSPAAPETDTTWSTLIRVGDAALDTDATVAEDVGAADWVGSRLGTTLFAVAQPSTTRLVLASGAAPTDGCVAGLTPFALVDVVAGSATVQVRADASGVAVVGGPIDLPDAGVPGTDASVPGSDASIGHDGGGATSDGGGPATSTGGCGCRIAHGGGTVPAILLAALALVTVRRTRRR